MTKMFDRRRDWRRWRLVGAGWFRPAGARLSSHCVRDWRFALIFASESALALSTATFDIAKFSAAVAGHDAVVHLACISNDASF